MKKDINIYGGCNKPFNNNCNNSCFNYYDYFNCQTGSKNFYVSSNSSNVKVDCVVDNKCGVNIYGKAVYRNNTPCKNAVVLLYKYENNCGNNLVYLKKAYTDCSGRYKFDLLCKEIGKYVIKVEICNDICSCNDICGLNTVSAYNHTCDCNNGCGYNDSCGCNDACSFNEGAYYNNLFYNYNHCTEDCCDNCNQYVLNTLSAYKNNCKIKATQCNKCCSCC